MAMGGRSGWPGLLRTHTYLFYIRFYYFGARLVFRKSVLICMVN